MNTARAYVYAGNWVSDCPQKCGNVELLVIEAPKFVCSYCYVIGDVEWPTHMNEITTVLERRPVPHTRNWYPKGHETAIKFRLADGQSIDDLMDENLAHGVF